MTCVTCAGVGDSTEISSLVGGSAPSGIAACRCKCPHCCASFIPRSVLRFYPLFGKASVAYPGTFSRSQANRQQGDDVLSCSIFWQRFGSVEHILAPRRSSAILR